MAKQTNATSINFKGHTLTFNCDILSVTVNNHEHKVVLYKNYSNDGWVIAMPDTGLKAQAEDSANSTATEVSTEKGRILVVAKSDTIRSDFRSGNINTKRVFRHICESSKNQSWNSWINNEVVNCQKSVYKDRKVVGSVNRFPVYTDTTDLSSLKKSDKARIERCLKAVKSYYTRLEKKANKTTTK